MVTANTANLAANAPSLTITGYGFDTNHGQRQRDFRQRRDRHRDQRHRTSLTVSLTGLSSLTAGTALHASVTVDGVSSGSCVQVATVAPVVTAAPPTWRPTPPA